MEAEQKYWWRMKHALQHALCSTMMRMFLKENEREVHAG